MASEVTKHGVRGANRIGLWVSAVLLTGLSVANADPHSGVPATANSAAHSGRPSRVVALTRASLDLASSGRSFALHEPPQSFRSSAIGVPQRDAMGTTVDAMASPRVGFPSRWQKTPANLSPQVVSLARNFRRNGLPILRLWGSGRNLVAVGLSPRRVPGVYFTQKID